MGKAKRTLESYRASQAALRATRDAMEALISDLTRITASLSEHRVTGHDVRDKVGELVADMEERYQDVVNAAADCVDTIKEAQTAINSLDNPLWRWLLSLRHLNGWKWNEIADKMEITEHAARQMEQRAIAALDVRIAQREIRRYTA